MTMARPIWQVRNELLLQPAELPDAALKAVWVALDDDSSGYSAPRRNGPPPEPPGLPR